MKNRKLSLILILGVILTLGLSTAFASNGGNDKKKKKRPKNTGILSVQTTPNAMTVKVDGQVVGQSGVAEGAEFYLTPGVHLIEIEGPNGQTFTKEINVVKNVKNCICLDVVEKKTTRPCPYDMRVSGPDRVQEGDLATFVATNVANITPAAAAALNYAWRVTPSSAQITSGLGTNSITVDTTGIGDETINVELDVTDGVYDASCRQNIAVNTAVEKPEPVVVNPLMFDEFQTMSNDDDKARLDNLAIELQNNPDARGYVIMYQGTDKGSQSRTAEKLSKFALDYLVNQRGVDPGRLDIVQGGARPTTTYQIWLVPPGASTPVPN